VAKQNNTFDDSTQNIIDLLLTEVTKPSFSHSYVVERYLELLRAKSICSYINTREQGEKSWLHGIKDPTIATVIAAIHAHPNHQWSVSILAKLGALSPSRFAARFTQIVGVSPMNYVTRWRMYLASKLLVRPKSNIERIATEMGYDNVAAFSRAFKRTMGVVPGVWRAEHSLDN